MSLQPPASTPALIHLDLASQDLLGHKGFQMQGPKAWMGRLLSTIGTGQFSPSLHSTSPALVN